MKRSFLTAFLSLSLLGSACARPENYSETKESKVLAATKDPNLTDVIVQLFNWPFAKITDEMPVLAEIGYAQIHVSPPNLTIDSDKWWARYQPVDYRIIAGPLGTEDEFKAMIAKAHEHGIKIIVDIVFNHTANPTSRLPKEAAEIVSAQGPLFFDTDYNSENCISNYDDTWQVRNERMCGGSGDKGLPDLDQDSAHVLEVQRAFLLRLNAMGVDGYRLDAVKHMDPAYFPKLLTKDITEGKFIFGEVIADQNTWDRDLKPYLDLNLMSLYDFPLRRTMQEAFGLYGSLSTLVDTDLSLSKEGLPWNRSVSFVMNHDIPNNAGFRAWIPEATDEILSYAYILGRSEGVPYVYSDLGTKGGAGLIDDRWDHFHRNKDVAQMVKFHNFVSGEPMTVRWADECTMLIQRGIKGVFAINKCAEVKEFDLAGAVPADAQVSEMITQTQLNSGKDNLHVRVPPRSSRFYIFEKAVN